MEKIADVDNGFFKIAWLLSAGDLVLHHKDQTVRVLDGDIKKRSIGGFCVNSEIIGIPDKEIKVPDYVLTKRDEVRKWRLKKQSEARYRKLGEVFTEHGMFTFFSCFDLLIVEFEDKTARVDDENITNADERYFVDTYAIFPNSRVHKLEISQEILEKLAKRRKEYEFQKHFKPILQTNDENGIIDFYLKTTGELIIKRGDKQAVVDHIEVIYGKKAVRVDSLLLNHPYLELPSVVETAFVDMQAKLGLVNLRLLSMGVSLLDGKEYFKLSGDLPSEDWNKVKAFFVDFGNDSDLQGMLTCVPERVSKALGIEFKQITA